MDKGAYIVFGYSPMLFRRTSELYTPYLESIQFQWNGGSIKINPLAPDAAVAYMEVTL